MNLFENLQAYKESNLTPKTEDFKLEDSDYYWGVHSTLPDGSSELIYEDDVVTINIIAAPDSDDEYAVVAFFDPDGTNLIQGIKSNKDEAIELAKAIYDESRNYQNDDLLNPDNVKKIANELGIMYQEV